MSKARKRTSARLPSLCFAASLAIAGQASAQRGAEQAGDTDAVGSGPAARELWLGVSARPQWALHMLARTEAGAGDAAQFPELAALAAAVEDAAGTARAWPLIDAALLGEDDLVLREWLEGLPLERIAGFRFAYPLPG